MQENSFYRSEDFHAIIAGALILITSILFFFISDFSTIKGKYGENITKLEKAAAENAPFKTVAWQDAYSELQAIRATKTNTGSLLKKISGKPGSWKSDPLESMQLSSEKATGISDENRDTYEQHLEEVSALKVKAQQAEEFARQAGFSNQIKNQSAEEAIENWKSKQRRGEGLEKRYKTKPYSRWGYLLVLFLLFAGLFGVIHRRMGVPLIRYVKGFAFVFLLGAFSYFLAGHSTMKEIGFGYAAWAILLGLLISNTIRTPDWIKPSLSTELYIKTGLVILGAEILLTKILAIGVPGIFVAWIVTPIVLVTTYWFGQKILKIGSKTLNITVSADMSVCGVSAAVATAAACKASKEELTLAIGLSMIFTSIMMIIMPLAINAMGLPEVLGGAWIGGTIDATGAVVAAGAFLGDTALNVAATIKMIQNILIGVIAFGVAIYFTRMGAGEGVKVGAGEIWRRFPKFVLGFIGASILFSIFYAGLGSHLAYSMLDQGVIDVTSDIRDWLFCLAFVSIGLSTNFQELKKHFSGGKPLILYVCGQTFNLALTLLMAYIMFYLVFPHITESI